MSNNHWFIDLHKCAFRFLKVGNFAHNTSFSSSKLNCKVQEGDNGLDEVVYFTAIFDCPEVQEQVIEDVSNLTESTHLEESYESEIDFLQDIASKIFVPLFNSVKFEIDAKKKYKMFKKIYMRGTLEWELRTPGMEHQT